MMQEILRGTHHGGEEHGGTILASQVWPEVRKTTGAKAVGSVPGDSGQGTKAARWEEHSAHEGSAFIAWGCVFDTDAKATTTACPRCLHTNAQRLRAWLASGPIRWGNSRGLALRCGTH